MTFRPTLLHLLTLLLVSLTCTAGAMPSAPPPPPIEQNRQFDETPKARPARFTWPLAPPHPVLRPFEPPSTAYGPGHRGVDLGTAPNAPILAAGPGVVVFAGPVAGRGVVSIDHAGGIRTTYQPVAAAVTRGQHVEGGTPIGRLTADSPTAGHCREPCLHWGARRDEQYLDPLGLLSTGRVRLKPWDP